MRVRHKYRVAPVKDRQCDGWTFDSKAEMARYQELKLLREAGAVRFFLRQVPFHLPGKTKYVCDFLVVWREGDLVFEDVKGVRTSEYKLKKRQVEELYGIEITEK